MHAAVMERLQRFIVGCRLIASPAQVTKKGVFGADSGIVKTGSKRMGVQHLAVFILEEERHCTVENSQAPEAKRGRMGNVLTATTGGFDAEKLDSRVTYEPPEETYGIRPSSYAGNGHSASWATRLPPFSSPSAPTPGS